VKEKAWPKCNLPLAYGGYNLNLLHKGRGMLGRIFFDYLDLLNKLGFFPRRVILLIPWLLIYPF